MRNEFSDKSTENRQKYRSTGLLGERGSFSFLLKYSIIYNTKGGVAS